MAFIFWVDILGFRTMDIHVAWWHDQPVRVESDWFFQTVNVKWLWKLNGYDRDLHPERYILLLMHFGSSDSRCSNRGLFQVLRIIWHEWTADQRPQSTPHYRQALTSLDSLGNWRMCWRWVGCPSFVCPTYHITWNSDRADGIRWSVFDIEKNPHDAG